MQRRGQDFKPYFFHSQLHTMGLFLFRSHSLTHSLTCCFSLNLFLYVDSGTPGTFTTLANPQFLSPNSNTQFEMSRGFFHMISLRENINIYLYIYRKSKSKSKYRFSLSHIIWFRGSAYHPSAEEFQIYISNFNLAINSRII